MKTSLGIHLKRQSLIFQTS